MKMHLSYSCYFCPWLILETFVMVGHIKKLHIKINKLTIEITSFSLYGTRTLQPI
jgi:hypothetical protein